MNSPKQDSAKQLLAGAGLPEDFLDKLVLESDWSFVIKLHALFEALLGRLVVRKLGNESLAEAVSNLDFNHAKAGKVAFAKALELVGTKEATFLRALSELRNRLVHDVRNVTFDLRAHLVNLDANQRASFRKQFGYALIALEGGEAEYERFVKTNPLLIIYFAAYSCLLSLEFNMSNARIDLLVDALRSHVPQRAA